MMPVENQTLLLIEDNPDHAELAKRALQQSNLDIKLFVVNSITEALSWLTTNAPEIIIADLCLPDGVATELLTGDINSMPYPLVVISSQGDEKKAVESLKAGALDYVVKSPQFFIELPQVVLRAMREWQYLIERKHLIASERKQYALAQALINSAAVLNSTLSLDEVFLRILKNLESFITYDIAIISLIDGVCTQVKSFHKNNADIHVDMEPIRIDQYINYLTILNSGQPLLINDVNLFTGWQKRKTYEWVRSYIGIPLTRRDQVIGFLNLYSAKQDVFFEDDLPSLSVFANQASIAIENAKLYSEIEQLSIRDELTHVLNRRGLMIRGQQEIERANRYQHPLSIVFLDVDQFKQFNDKYGYEIGDKVLQALADCLRNNLRDVDIIARFGGDEFVLLLPETNINSALEIAKRIQANLKSFEIKVNEETVYATISTGICQHSPNENDLSGLVNCGGKALHLAKSAGKNQTWII
jgi:diguanylate cyclase (GGDEF)-like protein